MGRRKEFIGTVMSNRMNKTIIVRIMHLAKHAKYGKVIRHYNKYKAHDEKMAAGIGDTVKIRETRPLSKDKHFRLVSILKKSIDSQLEQEHNAVV